MTTFRYVALLQLAAACASTPHTYPGEMSAAEHQAEAAAEAQQARDLAREEPVTGRDDGPNPAAEHQSAEITDHWHAAAAHGAAAKQLIATENDACAGVSADARAHGPLAARERIRSVTPLYWRSGRVAGAIVMLEAESGLTKEELRRQVRCQLARAATLGYESPGAADDPLFVRGARADVISSTEGSFGVHVVSDDPVRAQEILRRAERSAQR